MQNKPIIWSHTAIKQLASAIEYIAEDSIQNAAKVRTAILEKIEALPKNPEQFPPDKYKLKNPGSYRAFELHHLRIAYFVDTDRIRILRVRHTSQEPKSF